jgi:hypothetical protein
MRYEDVDKDIRQIRNECPVTCSSTTGTGAGSCYCCLPPIPLPPLPPPPPLGCVTRVVINNTGRYRTNNGGSNIRVCS